MSDISDAMGTPKEVRRSSLCTVCNVTNKTCFLMSATRWSCRHLCWPLSLRGASPKYRRGPTQENQGREAATWAKGDWKDASRSGTERRSGSHNLGRHLHCGTELNRNFLPEEAEAESMRVRRRAPKSTMFGTTDSKSKSKPSMTALPRGA